ncbi:dihydroxyacetone kinase subunit DhaL [Clostridium formicaceticum]|uniref:phosphoenolpyruvate--glycerone phosphotransferase n=1 Tax=Clostridium formicaceticum TaxID=1497 RepID=A0AAC9WHP9_9CLOT|nr:dihydroxyacetone kinase subunit DhaL [Clostridium formicaceticum]AOY74628.1 dihydroxyacetone kinase subunit L [Clostridium formicaceticum]ARE88994.1 PTS-dependent dihydroxyacetone kinase, ADP-binding subunit DhaL [Clostridium formicaceticum]
MRFDSKNGMIVLNSLIDTIHENTEYLSEVDGAIGDGDHGINMNKGFMLCRERTQGMEMNISEALNTLGEILFSEIGGSMGPLYGTFFMEMAEASKGKDEIDAEIFYEMLNQAITAIQSIGNAKVGDKTLLDTLIPAMEAFKQAIDEGESFEEALDILKQAAERGRDSTKDLVAKIGRAARLGERSRGVLDAGATSCCLMLCSMADSMKENMA